MIYFIIYQHLQGGTIKNIRKAFVGAGIEHWNLQNMKQE